MRSDSNPQGETMPGPTGADKRREEREREGLCGIEVNEPQAKPRRTRTSGSLKALNLCLRLFLLLLGPLGGDCQPS